MPIRLRNTEEFMTLALLKKISTSKVTKMCPSLFQSVTSCANLAMCEW